MATGTTIDLTNYITKEQFEAFKTDLNKLIEENNIKNSSDLSNARSQANQLINDNSTVTQQTIKALKEELETSIK